MEKIFVFRGTKDNLTDDQKFMKQMIELPSNYVTVFISQWTVACHFVDMRDVFVQNHAARISTL